jgi:hypothetical protein
VSIRWIRGGVILFFLLFVAAVTWPGMALGNRILPLVLGLPFSMVWIASWVVLSFVVLVLLDAAEGKARDGAPAGPADAVEGQGGRQPSGGEG